MTKGAAETTNNWLDVVAKVAQAAVAIGGIVLTGIEATKQLDNTGVSKGVQLKPSKE